MKDREFEVGDIVVVHNRSLFAVPVKGRVTDISSNGALQVFFFNDNPGGQNVTKFDGTYFRRQQCRLITNDSTKPSFVPESFQKKKVKKVYYKKLTNCTCSDDPYTDACDYCLALDGHPGYVCANKLTGEYEVEE